jgi:TonB family protein
MRCLGPSRIAAQTLHRPLSLEQLEDSMHGHGSPRPRARGHLALACALSLLAAQAAFADSSEIAALNAPFEDALPQAPSVAERLAVIRERIQRSLEYPPLARLLATDGEALVRFEIDAAGAPRNVRVVQSSGDGRLDASAVRAVEAASPLPWVYGSLEVPVHFELEQAD